MPFFESLAIAGAERIHTQMIFWILTDCSAYSQEAKSRLVCELFKIPLKHFEKIECHTEFKNIDLLICADAFIGVLENKLKASQRQDQLKDYWERICEHRKEYFPQATSLRAALLTLVDEPPENPNWCSTSYGDFLCALQSLPMRSVRTVDALIMKEYMATLQRLTRAVADFQKDHRLFPNVFSDGWKSKFAKSADAPQLKASQAYIASTHLETVLQKSFLRLLLADMQVDLGSVILEETRGTAFFEIPLRTIHYRGHEFSLGFQLQGRTMKFNIGGRDYRTSRPDWIDEPLKESFRSLVCEAGYKRFNPGRTYAYLSGSRYLPGELYEVERSTLVQLLAAAYQQARQAAEQWVPPGAPRSRRPGP